MNFDKDYGGDFLGGESVGVVEVFNGDFGVICIIVNDFEGL